MANISVPKGLIPTRYRSGAMWTGAANVYFVPASDATALFYGDPVKGVTASADANGITTVTAAADNNTLLGVMVGVISAGDPPIAQTRDKPVYRPASTAAYVLVVDDPDVLFEAEVDAALTVAAGGRNIGFTVAAGSTFTGYSGVKLTAATIATTNTLSLRVYRPVERADNDPTLTAAKWLVSINLHALRTTLGV